MFAHTRSVSSLSMNRNTSFARRTFRIAIGLLLALGLNFAGLGQAPAAHAQSSVHRTPADVPSESDATSTTSHWRLNVDDQLAQSLRRFPSLRGSQIRLVIRQASENEDLRLPETTYALLHVVKTDSSRDHRIMAVQALHTLSADQVGHRTYRQTMKRLYDLMEDESSKHVRGLVGAMLEEYANRS